MPNYLVTNINCGGLESAYLPNNVVRTAITSYAGTQTTSPPVVLGSVIAKTQGYYLLNYTWNEFSDLYDEAYSSGNYISFLNALGVPVYYIAGDSPSVSGQVENITSIITPPLITTDQPNYWFTVSVDSYITGISKISYSSLSPVDMSNPLMLLVIGFSRYSSAYPNTIYLGWTNKNVNYISQASRSIIVDNPIEVDVETPPNEARPIPTNNSLLPAPSTVRFGLRLIWEDFELEDYYVQVSSEDFSEGFRPINDYSGAEISADFMGVVDVIITHQIYEISVPAHYEVVEQGVYDPGGTAAPGGGTGNFNDGDSDDIRQLIPPGSAGPDTSNLGLYTRYLMTASQIRDFGDYLYADDIVDAVVNGIMKALFDSPAEAVISLMHYPFNVSSLVSSGAGTIWFGNINTGKSSSGIMSKSSARIEWGKLNLTEYWGNFLDYAPHTKIDLYLPWCVGSVPIDPHECLPGTLEVITNIEFDKGTCIHSVIGNKNAVIGTYSGVVGTQIPVTALDSAGKTLAFVTAAVSGLVSAGATGLAAGAGMAAGTAAGTHAYTAATIGGATSEMATRAFYDRQARVAGRIETAYTGIGQRAKSVALSSAAAAFRVPANIVRNGSFNGSGASLGVQVPYIIISRPTQSVPQNYGRYYGYPSNIYASLGSLSGYTEIGSIHLEGFSCTVEEIKEIEELLIGGVIL